MNRETVSEIVRHSLNEAFAALHGRGAGAGEWGRKRSRATMRCRSGATAVALRLRLRHRGRRQRGVAVRRLLAQVSRSGSPEEPHADPGLCCLAEAVLILECGWADGGMDPGRIRDDFQKLLVGRARVRCMIWEDNKGEDDPAVAEWLVDMMSECLETPPTTSICSPAMPAGVSATGTSTVTGRSTRCRRRLLIAAAVRDSLAGRRPSHLVLHGHAGISLETALRLEKAGWSNAEFRLEGRPQVAPTGGQRALPTTKNPAQLMPGIY